MNTHRQYWLSSRPLWFRVPRLLRVVFIITSLVLGPFRRRWRFDPSLIRVLLLIRDLHSPLPALVNGFLAQGISAEHILLLDSGSTDQDCLQTLSKLEQRGCRWIRLQPDDQPYGPYACWMCPALWDEIRSWSYPYIVSDTDLEFPANLPVDWLYKLFVTLNKHGGIMKSALPLRISDITTDKRVAVTAHELSVVHNRFYSFFSMLLLRHGSNAQICPTDTTLSMYRPSRFFSTFSMRLPLNYSICHLPWYSDFIETSEYKYYQSHKLPHFGEWS